MLCRDIRCPEVNSVQASWVPSVRVRMQNSHYRPLSPSPPASLLQSCDQPEFLQDVPLPIILTLSPRINLRMQKTGGLSPGFNKVILVAS